jgi:hypothetical protein
MPGLASTGRLTSEPATPDLYIIYIMRNCISASLARFGAMYQSFKSAVFIARSGDELTLRS